MLIVVTLVAALVWGGRTRKSKQQPGGPDEKQRGWPNVTRGYMTVTRWPRNCARFIRTPPERSRTYSSASPPIIRR
jgi:hypothetical protein